MIFLVHFPYLCADLHMRKQTVPKVAHYAQEMTFSWHTSATCPECAPIPLVSYRPSHVTLLCLMPTKARKRKTWKARFRCYLRLSAHRTSNQDWLLCYPTVNKITYNPQISKFPWPTSRTYTGVPRAMYCCLMSKSCSTLLPYLHIRKAKDTPNSTSSVLFKALCTLELKARGAAKWSNWAKYSCIMLRKESFPDTQAWLVQKVYNCLVCSSVHEKYAL